jgi:hypothetical protein
MGSIAQPPWARLFRFRVRVRTAAFARPDPILYSNSCNLVQIELSRVLSASASGANRSSLGQHSLIGARVDLFNRPALLRLRTEAVVSVDYRAFFSRYCCLSQLYWLSTNDNNLRISYWTIVTKEHHE